MKLCLFPFLQADLGNLLKPLSDLIQQVQNFREKNRASPVFNHLSAVSESVPGFCWVAVVRRCLLLLPPILILLPWFSDSFFQSPVFSPLYPCSFLCSLVLLLLSVFFFPPLYPFFFPPSSSSIIFFPLLPFQFFSYSSLLLFHLSVCFPPSFRPPFFFFSSSS